MEHILYTLTVSQLSGRLARLIYMGGKHPIIILVAMMRTITLSILLLLHQAPANLTSIL
jgi:hypothetical protein